MSEPKTKELGVAYPTPGEVYSAAIILPVLGIISLAIRWYQRCQQRYGIGIDDWLMVPSLVCLVLFRFKSGLILTLISFLPFVWALHYVLVSKRGTY